MSLESDLGYNVVLEYTEHKKGYAQIREAKSFENETAFNQWYTSEIKKDQKVIEQGVTPERALDLVDETPASCYITLAYEKARIPFITAFFEKILRLENVVNGEIFERERLKIDQIEHARSERLYRKMLDNCRKK